MCWKEKKCQETKLEKERNIMGVLQHDLFLKDQLLATPLLWPQFWETNNIESMSLHFILSPYYTATFLNFRKIKNTFFF